MKKLNKNKLFARFPQESVTTKLMVFFYENCQDFKTISFRELCRNIKVDNRANVARSCRQLSQNGIIKIKKKVIDNISFTNQYKWVGL